ncbi:MAG: TDP-N-acetylfucosamine:lipid II N-acetylfucosaminyltransferase [Woeseiaceae bacterium]
MYVHVFSSITKHHIQPFLAFFRDKVLPLSRAEEHVFICCGQRTSDDQDWATAVDLVFASGVSDIRGLLHGHLQHKHHLIVHGLYDRALVIALFTILRKEHGASWNIWGSDLYPFLKPYPRLPHQVANMWLRRSVFRRMARIAGIPGDFSILVADLAGDWHHSPLNHPLRLEQEQYVALLEKAQAQRNNELTVLLGNSASATNRHEEALTLLSRFRDEPLRLIIPLSYAGRGEYVDRVAAVARRLFGDKVTILDKVLTTEEYLDMLAGIDVLLFNHKRQEGVGTINSALLLGKKVFLHHDVSTYAHLAAGNVELNDSSAISSLDFAAFGHWSTDAGKRNHDAVYSMYGQEAVARQYLDMFRSIESDRIGED